MKTIIFNFFKLLIILFLTCCGNTDYENDAIGRTYKFSCPSIKSSCQECDKNWFIKINNNENATIYSKPSRDSYLKSCLTKITYQFDSKTGSITINQVSNSNINHYCQNSFVGSWKFSKSGYYGIGFYNKTGCGFVR